MSKIDKIVAHTQTPQSSNNENYRANLTKMKFNNIMEDTDSIGEAILSYARTAGADMGSPESGIPIYALDDLIGRYQSVQGKIEVNSKFPNQRIEWMRQKTAATGHPYR